MRVKPKILTYFSSMSHADRTAYLPSYLLIYFIVLIYLISGVSDKIFV